MQFNHASQDERFRAHPGLTLYGIESYLAVPLRRRDGSYFGTLCTLDPAPTALDEDAAAIFTLLADLIAYELEADEQQRQQEAQIRALEDVIAIAGHDLRQPLTILLGRLQLLARAARRGGLTPEELAARVEELTGQVRRAVSLSETLLDIVHLEVGELASTAPRSISSPSRGAPWTTCRSSARSTTCGSTPRRPCRSSATSAAWARYCGTCSKMRSSMPPPTAGRSSSPSPPPSRRRMLGAAEIAVRDAGPGVPAASLPHLFERNYREAAAVSRGIQGSGLGLYIARQVIAAHGGRMWAEAVSPAGGLAVHLVLPLTPPQ